MTNANQSEEKRIYELDEISSLSPGLYVPVDQAALEMAKKFDLGTSLAGKADATELNEVREEVESIGKPLKLIGSATAAELNGTIDDLQPGWTYTLTDSGTLAAGDVSVDVGDEVAWSESAVWVKVGGDGGVKILYGSSNPGGTTYPDAEDVVNAVAHGKEVIIFWNSSGNLFVYRLEYMFGYDVSGDDRYVFRCIEDYNQTKILSQVDGTYTWSWKTDNKIPHPSSIAVQYSDQSTYAVGDYCMFGGMLYECTTAVTTEEPFDINKWTHTSVAEQIGNVETLLAAL